MDDRITQIKGIGDEKAASLSSIGIHNIQDLIEYFPFRYEDYELKDLAEVKHEERATLEGKVHSEPVVRFYGKKKSRLSVRLLVGKFLITAVFFNRAFLKKQFTLGQIVTVTGKWDQHKMTLSANEITFSSHNPDGTIEPIYPVGGDVTVKAMKRYIQLALNQFGEQIEENLPPQMLERYKLMPRKDAVFMMHAPPSHDGLKQARRRFVYEELLQFQLKMQVFRKRERESTKGASQVFEKEKLDAFVESLPFPLTGAQNRVVGEILKDMQSDYRMNRLLQGDVGSGKTVVAAIGLYASYLAGHQGALMVPTEILAEQHYESFQELLGEKLNVELLTGSVKGKKRREILERLALGEVDLLIGTHALIQDEVVFENLGLVITDEQHRFGVNQRRVLREKGLSPDVLYMTATPIPRTLAISVFGDMDVSTIDEMPAGRKPIETYWAKPDMLPRVIDFVKKELDQVRQGYVICPLIEESEKLDVQNAIDVHFQMQTALPGYQVGLMHGRLSSDEKEEVMEEFSTNNVQLLVSTTVVEVGVNVPNATIMVIYDAERFGLAQLHQLRGRVGRGSEQSYCVLLADPKSEVGKERMQIMTESNDGFVLSQRDLELRGPGDFFGRKQSGLPEFKVADLVHDYRVLEVARNDASALVESTAFWEDETYRSLRDYLTEQGVLSGEKLD
ncbi:ATP-dependent DNA helicase RecG [Bacillus hwajinpoensis]|uniref:ATP-dependent DNA helicase RecG n=1 Tax=Guptibacillus hwajinpoensis TaxID=208199 RepID=A0A845EYW3_9BACL|nr:ATP-dependent DNA helicase RecG [Pseudalkalibacillus hwajinpoensis]MYL63751.1 ATP-dependent DNA helicase RecG [Pseudalkalibacillus hwajinpoensis]